MGWSLGYDTRTDRFIGYGVPAYCDHPECTAEIDRGLAYVCCGEEPYGGDDGCGLYFCAQHRTGWKGQCERCAATGAELAPPFEPKPEHPRWVKHLLTDGSWAAWRNENPAKVAKLRAQLEGSHA